MPHYRYNAKDKTGRSVTGVLESPDEQKLINVLKQRGLVIISIKQERKKERIGRRFSLSSKVKLSELVLFSRQMATMINSGIPLVQCLDIMTEQAEQPAFKKVVSEAKQDVSSGSSFHEALLKHPQAFSPLFINMIKAGESSGALDDIMDRLATYLEKTDSLLRKVRSALVYPAVVTIMAISITLLLIIKVIPVFKSMYEDFGSQLPAPTEFLIFISDLVIQNFLLATLSFITAVFLLIRFSKTERGAYIFDRFKLRMPIFGPIFRKVAISKFSRTLSTLVKSGVPILTSLEIVSKTAANKIIEEAVEKVRASIREGENISDPLLRSKVFPPLVVRMIAVGEQTGELEKMLTKIADFYDDQVDASVASLTSLIEPLIIAFLGVVIGGIVICMFLPIFQLSTLVS